MKNIVLCGFMGCGKSTVGQQLAEKTAMILVDTDTYIEERSGKSIRRIFAEDGEKAFRNAEQDACRILGQQSGLIIATGGGAVLRDDNVAALSQNGIIVWLDISAERVLDRLQGDTTRPLLQHPDKEDRIRCLLNERRPLYRRAAHIIVDADQAPSDVAQTILDQLNF